MSSSRNNTLEFSSVGSEAFTSGGSATGQRYGALQIINDTVFSALVASNVDGIANLQTITIAAGLLYIYDLAQHSNTFDQNNYGRLYSIPRHRHFPTECR